MAEGGGPVTTRYRMEGKVCAKLFWRRAWGPRTRRGMGPLRPSKALTAGICSLALKQCSVDGSPSFTAACGACRHWTMTSWSQPVSGPGHPRRRPASGRGGPVRAALSLYWSSGQAEGQINRRKMLEAPNVWARRLRSAPAPRAFEELTSTQLEGEPESAQAWAGRLRAVARGGCRRRPTARATSRGKSPATSRRARAGAARRADCGRPRPRPPPRRPGASSRACRKMPTGCPWPWRAASSCRSPPRPLTVSPPCTPRPACRLTSGISSTRRARPALASSLPSRNSPGLVSPSRFSPGQTPVTSGRKRRPPGYQRPRQARTRAGPPRPKSVHPPEGRAPEDGCGPNHVVTPALTTVARAG